MLTSTCWLPVAPIVGSFGGGGESGGLGVSVGGTVTVFSFGALRSAFVGVRVCFCCVPLLWWLIIGICMAL